MKFLGFVLLVVGIFFLIMSSSAVHTIEGLILLLIASVWISAGAIVDAIYGVWKTLVARLPHDNMHDVSAVPGTSYVAIARDIFVMIVLFSIAAAIVWNWDRISSILQSKGLK